MIFLELNFQVSSSITIISNNFRYNHNAVSICKMDTLMILKNDSNQRWTKFWYRKYSILIVEKFDNENSTFHRVFYPRKGTIAIENQGILHDRRDNLVSSNLHR